MTNKPYDVLIIGGGPAGSTIAAEANRRGMSVAIVEKNLLGGTCLNFGCDPTKTLLHTAALYYDIHHMRQRGIEVETPALNWPMVVEHVHSVIDEMRGGSVEVARENWRQKGVDLIFGAAEFLDSHTISVDGKRVQGDQIVISTGTTANIPSIPGLEDGGFITNEEAVYLPALPRRLAILGGGPIGVEFAQMFTRFGVAVTLIEIGERILPKDDPELAAALQKILEGEGVEFKLLAELREVTATAEGKELLIEYASGYLQTLEVDEILVAAGRRSVLSSLNPAAAGLEVDEEKWLIVDDYLRTNVSHIWGAGDVLGAEQFTHVASAQAQVVAHNVGAAQPRKFDPSLIPWVTYTSPALAHVGQTAAQLEEAGIPYTEVIQDFAKVARAKTTGHTEGMVKLFVGDNGRLLGGQILADGADDLIGTLIVLLQTEASVELLANTIFPYPTMLQGLEEAAKQAAV